MVRGGRPSNAALAEALFSLADQEPLGERRVALLRAGFAAVDAETAAGRLVQQQAPFWLKPIISQLLSCQGEGALQAAVQRLGSGTVRRRGPEVAGFVNVPAAVNLPQPGRAHVGNLGVDQSLEPPALG